MRTLAPFALLLLAACSSDPITSYMPEPYKVTIQQGNTITQDMVSKLRPGMSKSQVRFILGTPPITDMFHLNRWDYVYILRQGREIKEERKLTLFFENDLLARVAGDVAPTTTEDTQAEAAKPAKAATEIVLDKLDPNAPPIPPSDEKGFFGRMLESVGF